MKITNDQLKIEFRRELKQKIDRISQDYIDSLIKYMEETDQTHDYTKFINFGGFGMVFEAIDDNGKQWALKFQTEKDENFENSRKAWSDYSKIVSRAQANDHFVIKMFQPIEVKGGVGSQYFGVIKMELGINTRTTFLIKPYADDQQERANAQTLLSMIKKIIEAFYNLNFIYGYYHGDVRLDNIVYAKDGDDDSFDIRIIDFDFSFMHPELVCDQLVPQVHYYEPNVEYTQCNPVKHFAYTGDSRPPELKNVVPKYYINADSERDKREQEVWMNYRWDKFFREEVYAIGILIEDFLLVHKSFFNRDSEIGRVLWEIQARCTREEITNRYSLSDLLDAIRQREDQIEKQVPIKQQTLIDDQTPEELENKKRLEDEKELTIDSGALDISLSGGSFII